MRGTDRYVRAVGALSVVAAVAVGSAISSSAQPVGAAAPQHHGGVHVLAKVAQNTADQAVVDYRIDPARSNVRVVLECRDRPKGDFHVVDEARAAQGQFVDHADTPWQRSYRVQVEGPRGYVLDTVDLPPRT